RERELLIAHFGLDASRPALSLAQLGEKLGVTKARVRQLETRALRLLRRLLVEGEKKPQDDTRRHD
ncbi:MAG: sigma factor-like helix-turn-helix DNA-binding protein, partial [Phycisphaerae bacterium]